VLAIAATFEGTSFRIAYREYRRVVRERPTRLWDFIKASKDPGLFSVLLEDSAALIGIGMAAIGVVAVTFFQITWADGIASIAIGLLLASVAFVLANETRSLIAGEAVAPIVMERLQKALARIGCITSLDEVATLHLGPGAILVALTLSFRRDSTTDMIEEPSVRSQKRCRRRTSVWSMSMFGLQKESPIQGERSVNLWQATSEGRLIEVWAFPASALPGEAGLVSVPPAVSAHQSWC
jgi:hypothetical protein